jgi:D-glycero-D-manno-heptose 1,7-bisphosphate phosphatase
VWCAQKPGRNGPRVSARPAVFLDRDGTINVAPRPGAYVREPDQLKLLRGAAQAVRKINASGALAVIVTNQRWLSTIGSAEAFRPLDERLRKLLREHGARIDASYVCPHEAGGCGCRKPAPGMLLRAAAELGIHLARSTVIGDSATDMAAGRAAGAGRALRVRDHRQGSIGRASEPAFATLLEAVEWGV